MADVRYTQTHSYKYTHSVPLFRLFVRSLSLWHSNVFVMFLFFELVKNVKNIVVANEQRTKTNCLAHTRVFLHVHHTHFSSHFWQGTSSAECIRVCVSVENEIHTNFTWSQWNVWFSSLIQSIDCNSDILKQVQLMNTNISPDMMFSKHLSSLLAWYFHFSFINFFVVSQFADWVLIITKSLTPTEQFKSILINSV